MLPPGQAIKAEFNLTTLQSPVRNALANTYYEMHSGSGGRSEDSFGFMGPGIGPPRLCASSALAKDLLAGLFLRVRPGGWSWGQLMGRI